MGGTIRLYSYSHSSMSWVVRQALVLKAVQYETVPVDIRGGSDARERMGYDRINALGQVPVLEWQHEGTTRRTAQSIAILELLEELYPQPALLPEDRFLRARARELDWARHFIGRGLAALERAAAETAGRFLIGDTLSLPDLYLGPQLFNARRRGASLDGLPRLLAVEQNLIALACYRDTHPDRV